ncbi:MAG: hypothetical protein WCN92_12190 [Eubacteriales bacterium]
MDFAGSVTLTSTGTISGSATNPISASGGTATFSNLFFSVIGTGITIAGSSGSLTATGNSNTFNVTVQAAGLLLFEDDFNYTGLLTAHGYTNLSGTSNYLTAGTAGLSYTNYGSSAIGNALAVANIGEDVSKIFTQQISPTTVYTSFLVNISASLTGDYVFSFGPSAGATNYRGRFFIKTSSTSGYVNFGIANGSIGTTYGTTDFALNTTHLVVLKYQFTSGASATATVFINPNLYSAPSSYEVSVTDNTGTNAPADITYFIIRQGTNTLAPTFVLDGIRIGTNWGAVLGNPEYDATSSIAGGNYNTVTVVGSSELTANGSVIVHKTLTSEAASALIIPSGNSLTLASNCQATVSGSLTNSAGTTGLVIKSDATGTGSLITSSTPAATVERYLTNYASGTDKKYHFISSPVASQAIQTEFVTNPPTAAVDFYSWDLTQGLWINTKDDAGNWNSAFENTFSIGKGYMVAYPTSLVPKNFTGALNSYTVGSPLVLNCTYNSTLGNGWNLLGNPFSSSIDYTLVGRGDGIDNALYYYDAATENYHNEQDIFFHLLNLLIQTCLLT